MTAATTRSALTAALLGMVIAAMLGAVARPEPPQIGSATTGDQELADVVRALAGPGHLGLSVASIEAGELRFAGLGAADSDGTPVDATTPFEIGSMAKPLVGQALAELDDLGMVDEGEPASTILGRDVGPATLEDLATHRSGLPRLEGGPAPLARGFLAQLTGGDPYGDTTPEDVIAAAVNAGTDPRQEPRYSNLGFAFLGQTLATAVDRPFEDVLSDIVLDPLGMSATTLGRPPEGGAVPHVVNGDAVAPWRAAGYWPAGVGVWSSTEDLARLMSAMLEGTAPGMAALTPRAVLSEHDDIGLGWVIRRVDDREIYWHNGGTTGSRSFVAVEPDAGRAVAVLGNTSRPVDPLGWQLLDVEAASVSGAPFGPWITAVALIGIAIWIPASTTISRRGNRLDRVRLVGSVTTVIAALALIRWGGAWDVVGWVPWVLAAVAGGAGAGWALARWGELPVTAGGSPWAQWLSGVANIALNIALVTLLLV